MNRILSGFLAACTLGVAPVQAAAQDAPAPLEPASDVGDEIIVEGYTEKELREYLGRALIETGEVITRRSAQICVGIDNAPRELADPLKARIEGNLARFGIAAGEPGCQANTVIIFHRDAHAFVNRLAREDNGIALSGFNRPRMRSLIKPVRPIYAWHFNPAEALQRFIAGSGTPPLSNTLVTANLGAPGGNVVSDFKPAKSSHSFAVVDIDAIDGLTIEQLGDYLTLQALVELQPDAGESAPANSILRLFTLTGSNPDATPALSPIDDAMISQIYVGREIFRTSDVRGAIAREVARDANREDTAVGEDQP